MKKITRCEIDQEEIKAALSHWMKVTYDITAPLSTMDLAFRPPNSHMEAGASGFINMVVEIEEF